jgi:hypothetical protein
MSSKFSSITGGRNGLRCSLIWRGRLLAMTAWLLTIGVLMHAEDAKAAREHAQTPGAEQNQAGEADRKQQTANSGDTASCRIKSDDPAIATRSGASALPQKGDAQDQMSETSSKAASGQSLTSELLAQREWEKDQIHLGTDRNVKNESRNDKSAISGDGSDLKCVPHQATPKTESATPN